jgi:hypothetical protein
MLVGSALHAGPACAFELDFIQFNWLQVFRRAEATLLGSERRRLHQTRAVHEEKRVGL